MGDRIRKQQVVDVCLDTFMKKGLNHTTTTDLCKALNLNTGGVFYYFKTKDDIIIACAEEAKRRIENELIGEALRNVNEPEKLERCLYERAREMRPLMKFFVSVCALPRFEEAIKPTLADLSMRYKSYTEKFAEKMDTTAEAIAPYVYIVINAMLSYMLFGGEQYNFPQVLLVKKAHGEFIAKKQARQANSGNK